MNSKTDMDPSINISTSYISQYNGNLGPASDQMPSQISSDNLMMRDEDEEERHDDYEEEEEEFVGDGHGQR